MEFRLLIMIILRGFMKNNTFIFFHGLVTAQLPGENGYPGGKVMFVDTENTFRPNRLRTIADRFNLDHEAMLGNVVFCRAYTSEQQFELLDHVSAKFHEEAGIFKLLVCILFFSSTMMGMYSLEKVFTSCKLN